MRKALLVAVLLATACSEDTTQLAFTSGKVATAPEIKVTTYTVALESDEKYTGGAQTVITGAVTANVYERYLDTENDGVCMQGTGKLDVTYPDGNTLVKCTGGNGTARTYQDEGGGVYGNTGIPLIPYQHIAMDTRIPAGTCILFKSDNPNLAGYKIVADTGDAFRGTGLSAADGYIGPQFHCVALRSPDCVNVEEPLAWMDMNDDHAQILGRSPPGSPCPAPCGYMPEDLDGAPIPNAAPVPVPTNVPFTTRTRMPGAARTEPDASMCERDNRDGSGQPVTCDEFQQVDGVCDCGCKDYRQPNGNIINRGIPDIDCFVGDSCAGLDLSYIGWCGGNASANPSDWNVLTWCENGIVKQVECDTIGQPGRYCAWESDAVGWNCYPPRTDIGAAAPRPSHMSPTGRPPANQPMRPGAPVSDGFDGLDDFEIAQQPWCGYASDQNAICGPRLASLFSDALGRAPTANEARQLGMAFGIYYGHGITSAGQFDEFAAFVIKTMNPEFSGGVEQVPVSGVQQVTEVAAASLRAGAPIVGFNCTGESGHYFGATAYDPDNGSFYVGGTGTSYAGGTPWMTVAQMQAKATPVAYVIRLTGY